MSLTEEIDIASHDVFVDGVPFDVFARLRREAPVFWHRKVEDDQPTNGFWVVTRHADIVRVSRQWENFSSQAKGAILAEARPDLGAGAQRGLSGGRPRPAPTGGARHLRHQP